ncbi:MAG: RDD family protein, partial [Limisphaerales bacterium]
MDYKMIGGDGREYGPVTLDELKNWVREGRIGRDTLVARSDVGVWLAADKFTELAPELREVYEKNPALARNTFEIVGFWPPLGAFLLDTVVLWVAFSVLWSWFGASWAGPAPQVNPNVATPVEAMEALKQLLPYWGKQWAVYFPIHFLYHVLLNGTFGATLGKMIIGAKIVKLDGSRIGYGRALLRYIGARISDILYIGYLFVAFRGDKR